MLTFSSEAWETPESDEILDAIVDLRDREEAARFFRDLCTLGELHDLAQRWQVVRMLAEGRHYADVSHVTGASTATVTRIAQWLRHGTGGYVRALERRGQRTVEHRQPPDPLKTTPGTRPVAAGNSVAR